MKHDSHNVYVLVSLFFQALPPGERLVLKWR